MERSKCEQVLADGKICLNNARRACKLELKVLCGDCFMDHHKDGDHEEIFMQQVPIFQHLKNISNLKSDVLNHGNEIIAFVSQQVKDIQKRLRCRNLNC